MIITIQKLDGETFTIECDPSDYVDDLRDKVEQIHGTPIECQRYSLDGRPIDDSDTLQKNNIVENCTLVMEPHKITVILPNKKKLRVTLKPDDVIMKVKKAVSKKTGLPAESLAMIFDSRELRDGQTIAECNIDHEDTIIVETFTIRVSHWDGDVFSFKDINPRDTIDSVKQKVFELCQVPLDDQKYLHDERPVNDFLSLRDQLIPHKGVIDLQEPIAAKPVREKFQLSVFPSTEPVSMKTTLGTLSIQHWDGMTTYTLKIDLTGYIDDLKDMLKEQHDIPLTHQRLSYKGVEVDDTETLQDQGIEDGTKLVLDPWKVSIVAPGQKKPFKISILPTDKVTRIKRIVAKKCGIEVDVQLVFFQGVELKDKQTMAASLIEHGSELNIESFSVVVEHWNGEEYPINFVKPNDLLEEVKIAVEEHHGVPIGQQKYEFNGKPINDFMALSDQQIRHKSRLQLLEPPRKVEKREKFKLEVFGGADICAEAVPGANRGKTITLSIKQWNGEVFEVEFDPHEYVEALKEKIQEMKDIALDQQRLSHSGTMLDDADTLMENNIEDGAELVLEPMTLSLIVPNRKKVVKISICPDDKIKKIKRIVAKKCKLQADKLCVMLDGRELEDAKTILGCGIEHEDEVKVETFELSIAHWSGDVFVLDDIHPEDCIDDVKAIILKRKKIPMTQQKFRFNGKPIQQILSFKAQKIHHKSVLMMEDPQPSLFSPKSPRPSISHVKDVDTDDELDYDDVSDTSSVASWLKEAALDENYTAELCRIDASSESWLGMAAAKEERKSTSVKLLKIPVL